MRRLVVVFILLLGSSLFAQTWRTAPLGWRLAGYSHDQWNRAMFEADSLDTLLRMPAEMSRHVDENTSFLCLVGNDKVWLDSLLDGRSIGLFCAQSSESLQVSDQTDRHHNLPALLTNYAFAQIEPNTDTLIQNIRATIDYIQDVYMHNRNFAGYQFEIEPWQYNDSLSGRRWYNRTRHDDFRDRVIEAFDYIRRRDMTNPITIYLNSAEGNYSSSHYWVGVGLETFAL